MYTCEGMLSDVFSQELYCRCNIMQMYFQHFTPTFQHLFLYWQKVNFFFTEQSHG